MASVDILKEKLLHLKMMRLSLVDKLQIDKLNNVIKHTEKTIFNILYEKNEEECIYFGELESIMDDIVCLGHKIYGCKNDGNILSIIEPLDDRRKNCWNKWNSHVTNEICLELAFQIASNLTLLGRFERDVYCSFMNTVLSSCLLDEILIKRHANLQIVNTLIMIKEFEFSFK